MKQEKQMTRTQILREIQIIQQSIDKLNEIKGISTLKIISGRLEKLWRTI